ncbi:DinB family protein [Streptomyces sp. NPDC007088]|uniref:DinB family protein n=1 Tax=Streptomyces sp. NPDC007088 TaxID=3364773 RepID=UPI0036CC0865
MTDTAPTPGTERRFGWSNMFVPPGEDRRGDGGLPGERALLTGYLRDQRLTLELKCAGLDAEALARRSVPPSGLSLLGLVRHLADVERKWFREVMAGQEVERHYRTAANPDGDFEGARADPGEIAEAWRVWRAEVAFAERLVDAVPDLATPAAWDGKPFELREILVHLIEEYARHNGHADLLRELIDGRIGQ